MNQEREDRAHERVRNRYDDNEMEGLLDRTAALVGVEATELWTLDGDGKPVRVHARYKGLPADARLPEPMLGVISLVENIAREQTVRVARLNSLHSSVGIPCRFHGNDCVLVMLSYGEMSATSETVLHAVRLIRASGSSHDAA